MLPSSTSTLRHVESTCRMKRTSTKSGVTRSRRTRSGSVRSTKTKVVPRRRVARSGRIVGGGDEYGKGDVVVKNYKFYRRRGAIWTDLYHTPSHRRKLAGYRPDLEKSAEETVMRRTRLHLQKQHEKRQVKAKKIERIKRAFHQRRRLNAAKEFCDKDLEQDCETKIETRLRSMGIVRKDENWWRSRKDKKQPLLGLSRLHPERLHWVLSDKILISDFQAGLNILKKMETERQAAHDAARLKQERVAKIRQHFRERIVGRNMIHCPRKPSNLAQNTGLDLSTHYVDCEGSSDVSFRRSCSPKRRVDGVRHHLSTATTMTATVVDRRSASSIRQHSPLRRNKKRGKSVAAVASGMTEFRGLSTLDTGLLRKIERYVRSGKDVPHINSNLFLQMKALTEGRDMDVLDKDTSCHEDLVPPPPEVDAVALGVHVTTSENRKDKLDEIDRFETTHGMSDDQRRVHQPFPGKNLARSYPNISFCQKTKRRVMRMSGPRQTTGTKIAVLVSPRDELSNAPRASTGSTTTTTTKKKVAVKTTKKAPHRRKPDGSSTTKWVCDTK